ncbi:MAG: ankyrin repeat domain-containing protein, partial [Verrucomicrobiota bacterium]|nr:ankyrin repeat domain-containing protein [Verrucomicrobiota bacterium]
MMKHLLLTTIAAVVLVGCCTTQSPEPQTAKVPDISIVDAAKEGNIETVKQHLTAGADVNAKTESGWTPLHEAARSARKEIGELLIAKGAEVNAQGQYMATPLHYAAGEGHKEVVELLIAKGADVNAKEGVGGGTPLLWAASSGHKEIIEMLIAAGADVNAKSESGIFTGNTPLDWAIKYKRNETAALLRKHGGKTGEELKAAGNPTEPVAEVAKTESPT